MSLVTVFKSVHWFSLALEYAELRYVWDDLSEERMTGYYNHGWTVQAAVDAEADKYGIETRHQESGNVLPEEFNFAPYQVTK